MEKTSFRILVVDDEAEIRELISAFLEATFDCTTTQCKSGNEAIRALSTETFDCIVCDYRMPDGNGGEVYLHLKTQQSKIPFVLCSSDTPDQHPEFTPDGMSGYAAKPFFQHELKAAVERIVRNHVAIKEGKSRKEPYYAKIRPRLLLRAGILPCDIWVQLSEEKYVKFFSTQDFFGAEDLEKTEQKEIEHLYLRSGDLEPFFDKLIKQVVSQSAITESLTSSDLALASEIQEVVNDIAAQYGFTPELELLAKKTLVLVMRIVKKNPSLASIVSHINPSNTSYVSFHSLAIAAVSCDLATRMGWASDQTLTKLTLAAMLHDATLKNGNLARVQSESEFLDSLVPFTPEEIEQWRNHPNLAGEVAARFSEVPPDVDVIVRQHHEKADGTGWPEGLNHSRIAPLSALFIIAHDIVDYVYESGLMFNPQEYLKTRSANFSQGTFRRIIQTLAKP